MLEEPRFATDKALKRAGLSIDDIDLYEVNEAFAPVPLAWARHVGADPAKMNVNGGAIALGHPLGASGTKLMATLVRSEEHTSELQSLMRISYAVFCLKKKNRNHTTIFT